METARENCSDDSLIQQTKYRSVLKINDTSKNNYFDLVDTSDEEEQLDELGDEEDEDKKEMETKQKFANHHEKQEGQDMIYLDDSTSNDGGDKLKQCDQKDDRNLQNVKKHEVPTNATSEDSESISSNCETKTTKVTSNWTKVKVKGINYYTLPSSLPMVERERSEQQKILYPKIYLPTTLFKKMYEHQRIGVEWASSLHVNGIGGILGDDMGLGKTLQTLSLLGGLMLSKTIRNALVVCPKSLLLNWEREARDILENHCSMRVNIIVLDSNIRQEKRERILKDSLRW